MADEHENLIVDALWRLGSAFVYAVFASVLVGVCVWLSDPRLPNAVWIAIVAIPAVVGLSAFVAEFPPRLPRVVTLVLLALIVPCVIAALVLAYVMATMYDQL